MCSLLLRPLPKGQITIPKAFRDALGIDKNTYLKANLEDDKIILSPVGSLDNLEKYIRIYTDKEIKKFMEIDKLSPSVKKKAEKLLKK